MELTRQKQVITYADDILRKRTNTVRYSADTSQEIAIIKYKQRQTAFTPRSVKWGLKKWTRNQNQQLIHNTGPR
jgi:hypothetical protein